MDQPTRLHHSFDPQKKLVPASEPAWKDLIDRWYQLDETSFALCEAAFGWQQLNLLKKFDELIFLSPGGSNLADADFVAMTPASPSKFVYTLANIAPSVLCHLLRWSGPVYCYCPGNLTEQQETLRGALQIAQAKAKRSHTVTFIIEAIPYLNANGYRDVNGYFVY